MNNSHDQKTEVFCQAYRSFLSAEGEMSIEQIIRLYREMQPSIHKKVKSAQIDIEAFMYSFMRLPHLMQNITHVVMAQTEEKFTSKGYDIKSWEEVSSPARRRKMFYDGAHTLGVTINSVTDLDDVVCLLTALQIEWNKMHDRLSTVKAQLAEIKLQELQSIVGIDQENWERIVKIWGTHTHTWFSHIAQTKLDYRVLLLRGAYVDYKKAVQQWFENILSCTRYDDLRDRPIYFVSSNTHSLVNNLTGWVVRYEKELISYLKENHMTTFLEYWQHIESGEHPGSRENFLWYILKKYEKDNPQVKKSRMEYEAQLGIDFISAEHYLDIDVQIIPVAAIANAHSKEKFNTSYEALSTSQALIINIDYPLGFGAYMVMSTILQNVKKIKGVYILGKASFLHGNIGDIALPNTILDTYSDNTIVFANAFKQSYFQEYRGGSVLTNQKVVSSQGTFLHPWEALESYFLKDFTIIEMENGPYLNAVYENTHFNRYPENELVNLLSSPIDIGIIHYASDTPFTKAVTLGTRNLGYEGVEATYASSLAILKRIIEMEYV